MNLRGVLFLSADNETDRQSCVKDPSGHFFTMDHDYGKCHS